MNRSRSSILVVAAQKGGVGKTTLAFEVAAALDAILIDLDHHGGGATGHWGFNPRSAARAPLLDALERGPGGRPPRTRTRPRRPDLVPSHPDLSAADLSAEQVGDCLLAWAAAWSPRPVVVDTHPGAHWSTDGALGVADLVLVPLPPGSRELAATRGFLDELPDYPILIVPNMVPASPPLRYIDAVEELERRPGVSVGPAVSEHRWLRRRLLASAIVRQSNRGPATERAARELTAVALAAAARVSEARAA